MSVNEKMVQDIVQEVVAKMQISSDVSGKKGVFSDMNEAIEASKKAQKIVARMSMDQREAIISNIRQKIKENAEILARMGVEETGMGNVGHKILKHQLVAEKTPGTEDITTTAWSGDRGLTLIEMGPFGVIGGRYFDLHTIPLSFHEKESSHLLICSGRQPLLTVLHICSA